MLESAKGKIVAAVGMVACCGLSMAVALGLIAFTSTWVISGVAVAVLVGCVAFMVVIGHGHRGHDAQRDSAHELSSS